MLSLIQEKKFAEKVKDTTQSVTKNYKELDKRYKGVSNKLYNNSNDPQTKGTTTPGAINDLNFLYEIPHSRRKTHPSNTPNATLNSGLTSAINNHNSLLGSNLYAKITLLWIRSSSFK